MDLYLSQSPLVPLTIGISKGASIPPEAEVPSWSAARLWSERNLAK